MALVAAADLLGGQSFFHFFNAFEGVGFFGIFLEGVVLFRMTAPAGFRTDIAVDVFLTDSGRAGQGETQPADH
jgi:hypothetical protein